MATKKPPSPKRARKAAHKKKVAKKKATRRRPPPRRMSLALAASEVYNYALDITEGRIASGLPMIQAANRFLTDCTRTDIYWDDEEAIRVQTFFETHLDVAAGDGSGSLPFLLLPWQKFLLFNIFCWKIAPGRKKDGLEREAHTRRYRRLYLESAKGNGKTPLIVGMLAYQFVTGHDRDNEIFICAETEDQTQIPMDELLRFLEGMVEKKKIGGFYSAVEVASRPHWLPKRSVVHHKSENRVVYYDGNRTARANVRCISPGMRGGGLSGMRVTTALVTEYHEFSSEMALEMIGMSTKGKKEPLLLIDTNAGEDREGPCYDERSVAMLALTAKPGMQGDDYFVMIFEVDDGDEPFKDRKCWPKANPSLGTSFMPATPIIAAVNHANSPPKKAKVERLQFGVWRGSLLLPFGSALWKAAEVEKVKPHPEAKLFYSLDLARELAMAARAKVWAYRPPKMPSTKTRYWMQVHYWWNREALETYSLVMQARFEEWIRDPRHFIDLAHGAEVDFDDIASDIKNNIDSIEALTYDPYRWREIHVRLADYDIRTHDALKKSKSKPGLALYKHPQGSQQVATNPLWMGGSYESLHQALAGHRVEIEFNPILNWNVSIGSIGHDKLDNPYFERPPGKDLIDGIVAGTQGIGLADYIVNPVGERIKTGIGLVE